MSIAEKLQTIAENEQRVFDAGKNAELIAFSNEHQKNGERRNYQYAYYGSGWTDNTFNPQHDIICVGSYSMNSMFAKSKITRIPVIIDCSQATSPIYGLFLDCKELKTVKKVVFSEANEYNSVFNNATALENITIGGTIGKNGFNVSTCTKLTHDSLMSIINALKSGVSGLTVTLGATNQGKVSPEKIAEAQAKGWTVA
jgi:hypothetical protein